MNALRKENEKLPGLNELKEQNRLLGFQINVAHRERGTRSPVQNPPWKMPYPELPLVYEYYEHGGGKMRRRRLVRKSRRH